MRGYLCIRRLRNRNEIQPAILRGAKIIIQFAYYAQLNLGPVEGSKCDPLGLNSGSANPRLPASEAILLYPVPVRDVLHMKVPGSKQLRAVYLYDITGRRQVSKSV